LFFYKNFDRSFFRFVTVHAFDRRTDVQTEFSCMQHSKKCRKWAWQNGLSQRSGYCQTGPTVSAGDKERSLRRTIWPDPACRRKRTARPGLASMANEKRTCPVSTCTPVVGHGLNADRMECRPSKIAVYGHNANPSHTSNHHLVV